MGQGDACVIEGPTGRIVVVDGGGHPGTNERDGGDDPGARVVVPFLRHRGVSAIDLLVATHPHDDHLQGLIAVVERLQVRQALDSGFPAVSPPCVRLRGALARRGIPVRRARRGQVIDLGGGARIEVLGPPHPFLAGGRSDANNASIVLRVVYKKARVLLTGDAEEEAEASLVASGQDLRADVLKTGHHGSRWSSTDSFLDQVRPQIAVISCGKNNSFDHPHAQTLGRLGRRNVHVLRTDRDGAVTVETDGARVRATPTIRKNH